MNAGFFDHLASYVKRTKGVPPSNRLAWFYDNQPMELIRAWGHGLLGLPESAKALREGARARHSDGTYYRFEFKNGRAEPVKA